MRSLWLSDEQARAIVRHALADSPREACGIIGGVDDRAARIIPVANVAADPTRHYRLDDAVLGRALLRLNAEGLSAIGFYHSHPDGDPLPSSADIQLAAYPDTAYLIVGLKGGEPRLTAWTIDYGEVNPLSLRIGDAPPDVPDEPRMSAPQRTAILVAAALAVAFLLIISLSLLPPAPEIVSTLP